VVGWLLGQSTTSRLQPSPPDQTVPWRSRDAWTTLQLGSGLRAEPGFPEWETRIEHAFPPTLRGPKVEGHHRQVERPTAAVSLAEIPGPLLPLIQNPAKGPSLFQRSRGVGQMPCPRRRHQRAGLRSGGSSHDLVLAVSASESARFHPERSEISFTKTRRPAIASAEGRRIGVGMSWRLAPLGH